MGTPTIRSASDADRVAAEALLTRHGLPLDGFRTDDAVVAVRPDGSLAGVAALERHGDAALLRSVAVDAPMQGVGAALVRHLLAIADAEGRDVVLLTTTADGYFPRFGFAPIARADVPAALLASAEFRGACPASARVLRRPAKRPLRVLVLCTGNSCRSQMAEGWLRHLGGARVDVASAGVEAHGLNPNAVASMARAGVDIAGHASQTVDTFAGQTWDVVVTVCDHARDRCPILPGNHERVHAPFVDPAKAVGTDAEVASQFDAVRDAIGAWARAFLDARGIASSGGSTDAHVRTGAVTADR